jgi:hypothetical protein
MCPSVPASCTRHAACCCWGATCPARDCSEGEACARWHTCPQAATLDLCLPIMASHCRTSHSDWQTCSCVPDQQARLPPLSLQREGGPHFRHAHVLWPPVAHQHARSSSATAAAQQCQRDPAQHGLPQHAVCLRAAMHAHNCTAANDVTAATKWLHAAMQPLTRGGALRLERTMQYTNTQTAQRTPSLYLAITHHKMFFSNFFSFVPLTKAWTCHQSRVPLTD